MKNNDQLDSWFLENLVCPVDKSKLNYQKDRLICNENHHSYPIFKKIPIMLVKGKIPTHNGLFQETFDIVNGKIKIAENLQIEKSEKTVDPYVQIAIAGTNSRLYQHLTGKLKRYPIPTFPMVPDNGKLLLDIGCNWGRWCISASKTGFVTVGIDPFLESIIAAKRISSQLGIESRYLVADARFLPFRQNLFDYCYSYSVLQHFSKPDVAKVLPEIKYILKPGGISQIHMLNKYGLGSVLSQLKRGFREAVSFETRYWSSKELLNTFEQTIGSSKILLASFFTQGQIADKDLFTLRDRVIFEVAQFLKKMSLKISFFTKFGDNLFLISKKNF